MNVINLRAFARFQDVDISQAVKYISHDTFPEQDETKLHKILKVRFKSEEDNEIYERFIQDTAFKKYYSNPLCPWFLILRCDKVYPYTLIMISTKGEVLVGVSQILDTIMNPPGFDISTVTKPSIFEDYEILQFPNAMADIEYFDSVIDNHVFCYPIQSMLLGLTGKTEYHKDILEMKYEETEYHPINKRMTNEEVVQEVIEHDPDLDRIPETGLVTFPHYYPKHMMDYQDKPLRAINDCVIIRADVSATIPYIVAMETREDGVYFVTHNEANIYSELIDDIYKDRNQASGSDIIKTVMGQLNN